MEKYRIEKAADRFYLVEKVFGCDYYHRGSYKTLDEARKALKDYLKSTIKIIEKYDKYGNLIED